MKKDNLSAISSSTTGKKKIHKHKTQQAKHLNSKKKSKHEAKSEPINNEPSSPEAGLKKSE